MTFTYTVRPEDWLGIAPLAVLTVVALIVMLVDVALPHAGERSKHSGPENFVILPVVSVVGLLAALGATIALFFIEHPTRTFNNMVASDRGTLYAYAILLVAGVIGTLLSPEYLKRLNLVHQGEYYALFLLAITGMMLMAAATNFIIIFIGLELFSLALYILCSFVAQRRASQESGMKYFLLSSFASAFLLYGIAMIYAATNTTSLVAIQQLFAAKGAHSSTLLLVGLGLLTVGFAFKVSAVPFQSWTPDVYQGAPAPVTAFMSVGTKVAALLAFTRVFGFALLPIQDVWMPVVWAITVLTIVGGNVMALAQSNVKRMLAYSSIAHGGYLLIGVVIGGGLGATSILFYLSCYLFMNLGAFGVVTVLERLDNSGYEASDLRGLWYRNPRLAGLLALFLLSLAGFPPMAGFAGKYFLFYASLRGGHPELLIIGIVTSVLGIYYYLRFIALMFMEQREPAAEVGTVPTTPRGGVSSKSGPQRAVRPTTGSMAAVRGGTAVATRPAQVKTPTSRAIPTGEVVMPAGLRFMTRLALVLAAAGTLVVGVVLPFWLPALEAAAYQLLR